MHVHIPLLLLLLMLLLMSLLLLCCIRIKRCFFCWYSHSRFPIAQCMHLICTMKFALIWSGKCERVDFDFYNHHHRTIAVVIAIMIVVSVLSFTSSIAAVGSFNRAFSFHFHCIISITFICLITVINVFYTRSHLLFR